MPTCPNCGSWVDEGDSICSCGASVGGFSSGTENFENEISELYRQAHVFRDKGNYYDAIKLYEEIIDEIDGRNEGIGRNKKTCKILKKKCINY